MTKVVVLESLKKLGDWLSCFSKRWLRKKLLSSNGKAKFATEENILEIKLLEDSLLKKDDENKSNANKTAAKINELKFTKEIAAKENGEL